MKTKAPKPNTCQDVGIRLGDMEIMVIHETLNTNLTRIA